MKQRNFIGRLVGRKRNQRNWTQDFFADRLQLAGWYDATRSTVSKIEDCSLRIDLIQVYYIATALKLDPDDLLAEIDWHKQVEMLMGSMKTPQPTEAHGNHCK
jgi:transcriptional regulator with XRE-family HTH domain